MKTQYECTECHKIVKKWAGVCPDCGEYSSFEEVTTASFDIPTDGLKTAAKPPSTAARSISKANAKVDRMPTGIGELDRVLGGGFVHSGVALLGGEPGAGKSTLSLKIADVFAQAGEKVLYASGEESESQISIRAARMGIDDDRILLVHTSSLEEILGHIEAERPGLFIVDSLQAVASSALSGTLGSIQQSREAANVLNQTAKSTGSRAVLISQITKGGEFAGPEAIQHVVDVLLLLEGARDSPLKFLRTLKNRAGSTDEVGLFQHTDNGLEEVTDPSGILSDGDADSLAPGVAYTVTSEGLRSLPVELQALVTESSLPNPRKQFSGIPNDRCQIICAVLDKYCKARLFEYDVFASSIFGVRINDPVSDLAIAAAILSSLRDYTSSDKTAYIGELSLTGQVRGHQRLRQKVMAAAASGFTKIVVPESGLKTLKLSEIKSNVVGIRTITELKGIIGGS